MHKKSVVPTAAGIAAVTLAAGATAYVMNAKSTKNQRRKMKKTAEQAATAIGGVVNEVVGSVASNLLG